jgi:hypothetical protein
MVAMTDKRMDHRQKDKRIAELEVENWNLTYPVGQRVTLTKDSGHVIETITRSEAEVASSGHAVIWLVGISGYYLLSRVKPVCVQSV